MPRFVQVRCPAGNRRRAGHAFDATFLVFEEGELDSEQLALLVSDPTIEVQGSDDGETFVTIEAEDLPAGASETGASPVGTIKDSDAAEQLFGEIARLEKQVEDLTGKLSTANSALSSAESTISSLTTERDKATGDHQRVVDQLTAAQAKIVELGGPAPGDKPEEDKPPVEVPSTVETPAKATKTKTDKDQAKS